MWIQMNAKFKGTCRRCYKPIKKQQLIEWNAEKKTARHIGCEKGIRLSFGKRGRKVA